MTEKNEIVKPGFFSIHNLGEFLRAYLNDRKVDNVFARTEEGDFILNLLAHQNVVSAHVCDLDPHAAMTIETKKHLIENSNFEDSRHSFCGEQTIERLNKTDRWHGDSFTIHQNRDTHVRYLSTIEEFHRLKTQLNKIVVHSAPIMEQLREFQPSAFDLIYLGQFFDEPKLFTAYNWPEIILTRLAKGGHLIVRTGGDSLYLQDRFKVCGLKILETHQSFGRSTMIFTHA